MADDHDRGLYDKYRVDRTDGQSRQGQKHHGCRHFVLDVDHDPHALPALFAYAESCRLTYPVLSRELKELAYAKGLSNVDGLFDGGTPGRST